MEFKTIFNKICWLILIVSLYSTIFIAIIIEGVGNDVIDGECTPYNITQKSDKEGVYKSFLIKVTPDEFENKPEFDENYYEIVTRINSTNYTDVNIITRWPLWASLNVKLNEVNKCLFNNVLNIRYTHINKLIYKKNYQSQYNIYLRISFIILFISFIVVLQ